MPLAASQARDAASGSRKTRMTFLNPYMWFGALAVGIPLAMHFFYRANYRPLPWGAMKFLRLSIEQTSRRLRFQELILLIIRILVLFILAMALARPASRALTAGSGRGESIDAFLIIDTSYSMGARETDRETRLDKAKAAAIKVIDNLPPNSTVQVISCAGRATHLGPKTPTNLDQARHLIKSMKVSSEATDYASGFNEAFNSFDKTTGSNKEVYLIGDMQRSGWERQSSAIRAKCEEIKNQASIYLVNCTEKVVKNVAIVDILSQTEIPHKGARIAFTVLLRNSTAEPVDNIKLSLSVDGQTKFQETESITVDRVGAGDTRAVTISGKIEQAGWRLLTARISCEQDDIVEDNEFNRILLVHERIRVLIIDGAPNSKDYTRSGSFFIGNALLPVAEEKRGAYFIAANTILPENATEGSLAEKDICVLVNVSADALTSEFISALDSFVHSGKGLFITSGYNVVGMDYNKRLGSLLPARLLAKDAYQSPEDNRASPDIESVNLNSFLSRLKEKGSNPLVSLNAGFTAAYTLVEDPKSSPNRASGQVLMRYKDGHPMLLSRALGNGESIFFNTSADLTWSVICRLPAFVPFVNGCVAELVQRSGSAFNRTAGEPLKWRPTELRKEYYVKKPDGDRQFLGKPRDIEGELRLPAFDTSQSGVYQIVVSGNDTGDRFVFNPDLTESENLESISDKQIDDLLGFTPVHLKTGFDGKDFTGTERSRNEYTIYFLVVLLIFALGETVWAWICGRAW